MKTATTTGKWRRYLKYRPAGIEWLGEIPEHWEVKPLKRLGSFQAGAGFPDEAQGLTDEEFPLYKVSDTNLDGNELFMVSHNNSISQATAERLRAFIFPPETIVFAKVGAALLLNKRRILTRNSCIDNNLMGFIRKGCDVKWIFYWMCGLDLGKLANPGAVPSVNEGQLREIPVPIPLFAEQRAIAAYLDRETTQIDALIEKKQRQIELLQEKRAALISHAVTKGLNPNVKMRDSGVWWLGEIPEGWKATSLKRLGDFQAGAGFPDGEQGLPDDELPFYKVSDTNLEGNELFMVAHNNSISRATAARLRAFIFPPETIVFAKVGAALLLNKRRILTRKCCIDNNLMGFMRKCCDLKWAYYWMCGLDLGKLANPGAVPSVNEGQLREIPVPAPPVSEQHAIAAFLDRETVRIDTLAEKIKESIATLREYRTALISAAVTGKINVGGETA